MGTSSSENIALEITSEADTQAVKDARTDVSALGVAAKQASDEMVASFDKASASSLGLTNAMQQHGEVAQRSQGNVRSLAVEVSHLSLAFETGEGSALGMVRAASLAATEIAELSGVVEIAAGASVIGALVAIVGTIITLFDKASTSTDKFTDSLSRLQNETFKQLSIEEQSADAHLAFVNDQIKANDKLIESAEQAAEVKSPLLPEADPALVAAKETGEELLAQQKALTIELQAIYDAEAKLQQEADDRTAEHKRQLDDEAKRQAIADANTAKTMLDQFTDAQLAAIDKQTLSEEDAAAHKAIRDEARQEAEIAALKISEEEKTTLILAAQQARDQKIAAIDAQSNKKIDDATKAAQDKKTAALKESLDKYTAIAESALEASISSGNSYAQIMTKTLLSPLEKALEGLAVHQFAEAAADLATLNFAGAALHAAAGALAVEGAHKVAQIGGLSSGGAAGGSAPSGGSGAGSGNALAPKDQPQQGHVTVNLMTTDPYSGANIGIVSYQLQRAGILNRPIYVPPTTALRSA